MFVELETFIEFGDNWFKHEPRRREDMVFGRMTINIEYIGWLRRYPISGDFDFCEVMMMDHGQTFRVTESYEEMKALLKVPAEAA